MPTAPTIVNVITGDVSLRFSLLFFYVPLALLGTLVQLLAVVFERALQVLCTLCGIFDVSLMLLLDLVGHRGHQGKYHVVVAWLIGPACRWSCSLWVAFFGLKFGHLALEEGRTIGPYILDDVVQAGQKGVVEVYLGSEERNTPFAFFSLLVDVALLPARSA